MTHTYRPPNYTTNNHGPCGYCRKVNYVDKGAAKRAKRGHFPAEKSLTVYRCAFGGNGWHIGHVDVGLRIRSSPSYGA